MNTQKPSRLGVRANRNENGEVVGFRKFIITGAVPKECDEISRELDKKFEALINKIRYHQK